MRVVMANARAELSLGFKLPPNMASMSREEARAAVQAAFDRARGRCYFDFASQFPGAKA